MPGAADRRLGYAKALIQWRLRRVGYMTVLGDMSFRFAPPPSPGVVLVADLAERRRNLITGEVFWQWYQAEVTQPDADGDTLAAWEVPNDGTFDPLREGEGWGQFPAQWDAVAAAMTAMMEQFAAPGWQEAEDRFWQEGGMLDMPQHWDTPPASPAQSSFRQDRH